MTRLRNWPRELSAPLSALQGELNRLLESYQQHFGPIGPKDTTPSPDEVAAWTPAIDLCETPQEIHVWADLPGVEPAAVELSVTGTILTLRGLKKPSEIPSGQGHILERPAGTFYRRVPLSSEVEIDAIQAEARDGVLHVRLPKAEAAKGRTIPIRTP